MNPMFRSFLKSIQTKSQDAQNSGLWVNGMRQPMHENSRLRKDLKNDGRVIWTDRNERVANKVDSMYPIPAGTMQNSDLEKDRSKAFWHLMKKGHPKDLLNTQGKPAGAQDLNADGLVSKAEKELSNNPEDLNYDPGKALGDYADSLDEAKSSPEDRLDKKDRKGINPKSMLGAIIAEWDRQQAAKSGNPKAKSDAEEISNRNKSMQENTNRSMFLTHLQGMQTKSQDAQNPGLWVNGNRMPVQEAIKPVDQNANREVTPDEADMHADAAAAQTSKNRLGSEIGQHPEDTNDDGAADPQERQVRAKQAAAAANVSSDSWASMAAQHISGQAPRATPAPVGNDAY